jgi:hypothetical protein
MFESQISHSNPLSGSLASYERGIALCECNHLPIPFGKKLTEPPHAARIFRSRRLASFQPEALQVGRRRYLANLQLEQVPASRTRQAAVVQLEFFMTSFVAATELHLVS